MSASININDDEQIPRTTSPAVGKGFLFAAVFFIGEILTLDVPEPPAHLFFVTFVTGWFYWLYCVHRMHKILAELTNYSYPITPGKLVRRHVYPIYNNFWVLYWAWVFGQYLKDRGRVRIITGVLLGPMLLLAKLLVLVDGAVALTVLFSVTMYMSGKLAKHVEALGEPAPAQPAALPDPGISSQPVETFINPAQAVAETRAEDRHRIFGGLR